MRWVVDHPAFAAHFTDPLYSDDSREFTPFGNDEGADAFADLREDEAALAVGTLARVLRADTALVRREVDKPASRRRYDTYNLVLGFGFGLLRLTGQIDAAGMETLKLAVQRQHELWGEAGPEYQQMLTDLDTFPNTPRRRHREPPLSWYAVRCLFESTWPTKEVEPSHRYEERITLWRATSIDEAIALAEAEAKVYADAIDGAHEPYLGLAQGFALEGEPGHGTEVFSLMRSSDLDSTGYLETFFDTGREHQRSE